MDLLEAEVLAPGFMVRGSLAAAFCQESYAASPGLPLHGGSARGAAGTEGSGVLQVLCDHCTSVLVSKWLQVFHVPFPGHRPSFTPMQDLAICMPSFTI